MKKLIYHLLIFIYQIYIHHYCFTQISFSKLKEIDERLQVIRKYRGRYFTGWNFAMQTLFFGVCLATDVLDKVKSNSRFSEQLKSAQAFIYHGLVFPLTMFVSLTFWSLFLYDRELIYPAVTDLVMPVWLNHVLHTFIAVNALIETFISPHQVNWRSALLGLTVYLITYVSLFVYTYISDGIWIYPFLNYIPVSQVIMFFAVSYFTLLLLQLISIKLNNVIWTSSQQKIKIR